MTDKFYIQDVEWAEQLERGLSDYMSDLWEALFKEERSPEVEPEIITESGIYFCGNECCVTRETLFYVTPRIIKGFLDGKVCLDVPEGDTHA